MMASFQCPKKRAPTRSSFHRGWGTVPPKNASHISSYVYYVFLEIKTGSQCGRSVTRNPHAEKT
jgi:hypothetical protein